MKRSIAMLVLLSALSTRMAHAAPPATRTRVFEIDPKSPVLQESIVSTYKRWTNIHLPEEYVSVMCGDCISSDEGLDESAMLNDPRLWFLDKNPTGPSLHIRPLDLPDSSAKRSPESFTTELYIVLRGGYRIILQVRVVDIRKEQREVADSVVTITAPNSVLMSGRIREELAKKEQEYEDRKPQEDAEVLAANLQGIRECKPSVWKVPIQADNTVVRVQQLCATDGGRSRAFWVIFSVENLDDARLYLESAALVPADATATAPQLPQAAPAADDWQPLPSKAVSKKERVRVGHASRFDAAYLRHEEATTGIAVTTLDSKEPVPSVWKLVVTPHATDRDPVEVGELRY